MTDSELIKACQAGQNQAQTMFYNRYAGRLMGTCMRYGASRAEAEDIFQEALLKVFQNMHKIAQAETLDAWVKKIVINTAINHYHRQQKPQKDLFESDFLTAEADENQANIIEQLSHEELLAMIRELPAGYKMVFNLYAIEGYNHREIAEMLQTSESNSKNQYAKARKALQEKLTKLNREIISGNEGRR
jgi:RNA polymerase sigma factor (sigma-70 family)